MLESVLIPARFHVDLPKFSDYFRFLVSAVDQEPGAVFVRRLQVQKYKEIVEIPEAPLNFGNRMC